MTDMDYYLTCDHAARTRSMVISIAVGVACAAVATFLELPDKMVAFICGAVTIGTEIISATAYTRRYPSKSSESPFLIRRYLLRLAVSLPLFVVAPVVQAGIVDRKLLKAMQEGPPYNKAKRLLIFGLRNGIVVHVATLDVTRQTVTQAYLSLPDEEREKTGTTLAQILAYELYIQTQIKLTVGIVAVFIPRGSFLIGNSLKMQYVTTVGEDKNRADIMVAFDKTPQNPAVLVYEKRADPPLDAILAHLSVKRPGWSLDNAPALVLMEADHQKVAVMDVLVSNLSQTLDSIIWADVVFDHCRILYHGGPLLLKNVLFNDCEFEDSAHNAVLDKIRRYDGSPVTLTIS
jgi:hypothetical protein